MSYQDLENTLIQQGFQKTDSPILSYGSILLLKNESNNNIRVELRGLDTELSLVGIEGFQEVDNVNSNVNSVNTVFKTCITPKALLGCTSNSNDSGKLLIEGSLFEVVIDGTTHSNLTYTQLITTMQSAGLIIRSDEISCEDATSIGGFVDGGIDLPTDHLNSYPEPTRKVMVKVEFITPTSSKSLVFNSWSHYLPDALEGDLEMNQWMVDHKIAVELVNIDTYPNGYTKFVNSSSEEVKVRIQIMRDLNNGFASMSKMSDIYSDLLDYTYAASYNDPDELSFCLASNSISCIGATSKARWDNGVVVNGGYTITLSWTIDGVTHEASRNGTTDGANNLSSLIELLNYDFGGFGNSYDEFTTLQIYPPEDSRYNELLESVRLSLVTTGYISVELDPNDVLSPAVWLSPDHQELKVCLVKKVDTSINCTGESDYVEWSSIFKVFGNYELNFDIDNNGIKSNRTVSGYSQTGRSLILIGDNNDWPSEVLIDGDGNVVLSSNLKLGGNIRVRITADQGFNFSDGSEGLTELGSSTTNRYIDEQDRDVLEFCLHVEPTILSCENSLNSTEFITIDGNFNLIVDGGNIAYGLDTPTIIQSLIDSGFRVEEIK